MLANTTCWVIALGMMLADTKNREDLYIRTLMAMGFIFLGTLSKAVDVYREVHKNKNESSSTPASQTDSIMEREYK